MGTECWCVEDEQRHHILPLVVLTSGSITMGTAWIALLLWLSWAASMVAPDAFSRQHAAFVTRYTRPTPLDSFVHEALSLRGGHSDLTDDNDEEEDAEDGDGDDVDELKATSTKASNEEDDDIDADDDDETEADVSDAGEPKSKEKPKFDASLAAAALKSTSKVQARTASEKRSAVKQVVNTKLAPKAATGAAAKVAVTPVRKKVSLLKRLHIPYIVRAAINPWTLFAMTKAYWASFFNLNFLQDLQPTAGLELRSALEEKAKRSPPPGGSGNKGRRKMKRGQAKTISDLPQLST
jgi:hypothetical protein